METQTRLFELRKKHGLNQTEAGSILGLSKQQYGKLERGQVDATQISYMIQLAKYYNVSLDQH